MSEQLIVTGTREPENCLTVSEQGGALRCKKGLRIVADTNFENCPSLDALLIPGGVVEKCLKQHTKRISI